MHSQTHTISQVPGNADVCSDTSQARLNIDRLSQVRSKHVGGAQFLFGDGTCRFISENVDVKVYVALFTIQGGEVVDDDDF